MSTMTLPPLILKDGARLVLPSSANRTGSSATWLNLIIGIQPATPNGRYPSLNIDASSGASLDVGNNALFAANNPDWYVGALVATGRNNGFWDGAGIDSSAITSSLMAVGYATRGGAAVVAYTHVGDATVDGVINVGDLGALATYYGTSINALWDQADFDFNGNVNTNDLGALSTYYNAWSEPWSEPNPV